MFYAQFVLSKKGPLAKIWLAAHWEKKLTKAHVYETSIENSVEGILQPKVKMALRTSGHLLLGVVRIYSRKAKYLLADCNEAFVKIKMAFRPGAIDLPMTVVGGHMGDLYDPLSKDGSANYLLGTGTSSSALTTLTLPQVFHQFDTALSDLNDMDLVGSLNQAREDEITLKEDFSFVHFNGDGFGVITDFGADDFSIDPHHFQNGGDAGNHLMDETDNMYALADPLTDKMGQDSSSIDDFRREVNGSAISKDMNLMEEPGTLSLDSFYDKPLRDDGFGASSSEAGLLGEGFIGDNSLFDEAPLSVASLPDVDDDMDDQPTMPQADISTTPSTLQPTTLGGVDQASVLFQSVVDGASSILDKNNMDTTPSYNLSYNNATTFNLGSAFDQREIFALEPLDVTALSSSRSADASSKLGIPTSSSASISQTIPPAKPSVKTGSGPGFHHKRKLLVDSQKGLNGDEMKRQLADSSDLVTDLNLAPPSKRLMQWKETGGCGKLIKTLRGFGRTTRSKSPDRVLFSDSQSLSKLYNQQMSSAVKAIADMINKQVLSLNMIEDEERSIFGSGFNRQPHGLTNKQNTLDVNETKDPETPSKRIKLDSIPESPFKKLDGDFDDEESHASPGGYVDEGDDDEYFGLRNSDNQSQKTPIHLDKPSLHSISSDIHESPIKPTQPPSIMETHSLSNHDATPTEQQNVPPSIVEDDEITQESEEIASTTLMNEGETLQNFTDRVWGKRALLFFASIRKAFQENIPPPVGDDSDIHKNKVRFDRFVVSDRSSRKAVAAKFYSLLVLKKDRVVDLTQNEPYGTIYISKGPKYFEFDA